jgi:hypothetical protein
MDYEAEQWENHGEGLGRESGNSTVTSPESSLVGDSFGFGEARGRRELPETEALGARNRESYGELSAAGKKSRPEFEALGDLSRLGLSS